MILLMCFWILFAGIVLRIFASVFVSDIGLYFFSFFKRINYFLFLAALGFCCCVRAFSSCREWGLVIVVVHRLLIAVASLVAEHGL